MESQLVAVGEVSLNVNLWPGEHDQAPFLLVHGLASNARLWDGVAAALSAKGHQVVAIDQRGHGRSDKPDDAYTMDAFVSDLARLIAVLGLDRPVVVGQSFGGNVVLQLGADAPHLLRGVVGVDGGLIELGGRFRTWDDCARAMAPPKTAGRRFEEIQSFVRSMHPDWPETGIAGALANWEVRSDGTAAPWLSFERHMKVLEVLYRHRPTELFSRLEVPVLLIHAQTDDHSWNEANRAAAENAAAAIPHVRTVWMRGDHDLHAQYPVDLARLLTDGVREGFFE